MHFFEELLNNEIISKKKSIGQVNLKDIFLNILKGFFKLCAVCTEKVLKCKKMPIQTNLI